ncbi:pyridoxal phosphate-dependent transferase [Tanacetum coccineum]
MLRMLLLLLRITIYSSDLLIHSADAPSMPPLLSLPLSMACDDSDGCVTMVIGSRLLFNKIYKERITMYGSDLLIHSADAPSMPPLLSLPLSMACDDSDGCVTMVIGSRLLFNKIYKQRITMYGSDLLIHSADAPSMPPLLSLPLSMACDDSDGCIRELLTPRNDHCVISFGIVAAIVSGCDGSKYVDTEMGERVYTGLDWGSITLCTLPGRTLNQMHSLMLPTSSLPPLMSIFVTANAGFLAWFGILWVGALRDENPKGEEAKPTEPENVGLIYVSARSKDALSMKIKRIKDVVKFSSSTQLHFLYAHGLSNLVQFECKKLQDVDLGWTKKASAEAEAVAAMPCSGQVCSGDPIFMEPFWMQNAENSAVGISGRHRQGYWYDHGDAMSIELEKHIRQLHSVVGNAVTEGRYMVFGIGAMQLISTAIYALASENVSSPSSVLATIPYYPIINKTKLYIEDWIGLKTLDEAGRVKYNNVTGNHLGISKTDIKKYVIPYLKDDEQSKWGWKDTRLIHGRQRLKAFSMMYLDLQTLTFDVAVKQIGKNKSASML